MTKKSIMSYLDGDVRNLVKKSKQPTFVPPMLAVLTSNYFESSDWIYEQKFDGQRCLAFKKDGVVTLKSRNDRVINAAYPDLVEALTKQTADNFIIDGEIIALNKRGVSDFQMLQGRMNLKEETKIATQKKLVPVSYYVFDIMYVGGYDVRKLPLLTRKVLLKKLLIYRGVLKYSQHHTKDGLTLFKQACRAHEEGLIVKKADGVYASARSSNWLKFKCGMEQELVIIGYTEPQGARTDFGALLVGYYKNKKLHYAGKVGTGYSQETLRMLGKKLRALKATTSPVVNYDESLVGVHWVKPQLVAEIKFANWTKDNKLRVGRYKGLRTDKAARLVVQELPKRAVS
jgi:bifunctional non-homologous end joining protein LigD